MLVAKWGGLQDMQSPLADNHSHRTSAKDYIGRTPLSPDCEYIFWDLTKSFHAPDIRRSPLSEGCDCRSYGFVGTILVVRGVLGKCIYPPITLRTDRLKYEYCRVCGIEVLADLKILADSKVSARH